MNVRKENRVTQISTATVADLKLSKLYISAQQKILRSAPDWMILNIIFQHTSRSCFIFQKKNIKNFSIFVFFIEFLLCQNLPINQIPHAICK